MSEDDELLKKIKAVSPSVKSDSKGIEMVKSDPIDSLTSSNAWLNKHAELGHQTELEYERNQVKIEGGIITSEKSEEQKLSSLQQTG